MFFGDLRKNIINLWWGGWESNPLTKKERIYSPPRLSDFAASPYSAVSRVSLLRHITAKNYSTFISRSFSLKRLGESNRKLSLVCLLLRCFASAPLRDRVWLARRDSNHTFGCTSPRPKPLDDRRIYITFKIFADLRHTNCLVFIYFQPIGRQV